MAHTGEVDLGDLNGSSGFAINGINAYDYAGFSVAGVGDINGDGFADIMVGARDADPNGARSGEAYLIYGSAMRPASPFELSDLAANGGTLLNGVTTSDRAGRSVNAAGDINGDGIDDLVIGAVNSEIGGDGAGSATVIFGAVGGLGNTVELSDVNGSNGFVLHGIAPDDAAGLAVADAGDINGDGIGDLLIGAHRADPDGDRSGQAYVVFGRDSGFAAQIDLGSLNGANGFAINGSGVDVRTGAAVTDAGDVNGDGIGDIIVSQHRADANGLLSGQAFVIYGTANASAPVLDLDTIDGNNGFALIGAVADDRAGFGVAGVGDVNGDGFSDVLVGSNLSDVNGLNSGQSHIVFGSQNGPGASLNLGSLDGKNGFTLNGVGPGDRSGIFVSDGGDFNGDGFDDILIGAHQAYSRASDPTAGPGNAYLIYGGAALLTTLELSDLGGANGFVLAGVHDGDNTGRGLRAAGDLDGDGLDDLIIGAWRADPNGTSSGQSFVYYGNNASGQLDFAGTDGNDKIKGTSGDDNIVGGRGNDLIKGRGGNDVLIGGAGHDTILFDINDSLRVDGGSGRDSLRINTFGTEVDLSAINQSSGANYQVFENFEIVDLRGRGNTLRLDQADLLHLTDAHNSLRVNGTAADTVAVNDANWQLVGSETFAGQTYNRYENGAATLLVDTDINQAGVLGVAPGPAPAPADTLLLANLDGNNGFVINGIDGDDQSAFSVSDAGDLNGDGIADVVIGAYGANGKTGQTYVVYGSTGGFAATLEASDLNGNNGFIIDGIANLDRSGVSVSGAGDFNNDGVDDLLIGALRADVNGSSSGSSYVLFGNAGGFGANVGLADLDGNNGFALHGVEGSNQSGNSVHGLGDVNGDGIDDIVIGALDTDANGEESGASYVVYGTAAGVPAHFNLSDLDGSNGFVIIGQDSGDNAGKSVSGAGDVNGDGVNDIIVGAYDADGSGQAYVVHGGLGVAELNLGDLAGGSGFVVDGFDSGDEAGWAVSGAGDINNDGFADVIIGAPRADGQGRDTGSAFVVFGGASLSSDVDIDDLNGSNGFEIIGQEATDRAGVSVSAAGDVNGDGIDDLIVGAYFADGADDSFDQVGESYVVFGGQSFAAAFDLNNLDGSNGYVIEGIDEGDNAGVSVSGAGDVNGDGINDLIIGAYDADPNGSQSGESYVVFGVDLTPAAGGGTAGDDVLNGDPLDNIIDGLGGNDRINGRAGADIINGGDGNDTVVWDVADRVDGGAGTDTLVLFGSDDLDLSGLAAGQLRGIEFIDAETSLAGNNVFLDAADLLSVTDNNSLWVLGDANDSVTATGGFVANGSSGGFDVYSSATATLLIDQDIVNLAIS